MSVKRSGKGSDVSKNERKRLKTGNVVDLKKKSSARIPKTKIKKKIKLLSKTVDYSICVPTSLIDNCSSLEQITHAVYQVAKTATLFNVAEIVVLDLGSRSQSLSQSTSELQQKHKSTKITFDDASAPSENTGAQATEKIGTAKKQPRSRLPPALLISSLLQYFVTPPYLTKSVFKKEYMGCFQYASRLPRVSALPFMRHLPDDKGRYREGLAITMDKPGSGRAKKNSKPYGQTKYVNVGAEEALELRGQLVPANVRVTVDVIDRRVVSPAEAYGDFVGAQASYGYHVRLAHNFGDVFVASPFQQGYSQTIWVNSGDFYFNPQTQKSERLNARIVAIEALVRPSEEEIAENDAVTPANVLVFFGKWRDITSSFEQAKAQFEGCEGAHQFFDGQLELPGATPLGNICIEDSCMVAMTKLSQM
ncbi:LAMI_0F16116g1_1 [Lachancea mirantina]|uniref:LAMI_0F16116g1_1 n=1 Tax=Lachancea mirantina TaxID=1230905 RepID=A0A1G4K4U0_9SACH|nr:LAMI_0F16116g1_1 [Lachancea mirantina]